MSRLASVLFGLSVAYAGAAQEVGAVRVGSVLLEYGGVSEQQARDVVELASAVVELSRESAVVVRGKDGRFTLEISLPEGTWSRGDTAQRVAYLGVLASAAVLERPGTVLADDGVSEHATLTQLEPESGDYYAARGEGLFLLSRADEAIEAYAEAVKIEPKAGRFLRVGRLLFNAYRDIEAETAYRSAIRLESGNAEAHYRLGELTFQQGRFEESLRHFGRAIERNPKHADAYDTAASAYDELRRYDEAIAYYQRALAIEQRAAFYIGLGASYGNKGSDEEALAAFATGIERFPSVPLLRRNYASTLERLGRAEEAEAARTVALELYRQAVEGSPNDPGKHASLGHFLAERGRVEGAVTAFERSLALDERIAQTWGALGKALLDVGRVEEGVTAFERMVALAPRYGEAHYRLGKALEKAGRKDEASEAFDEAARLGYPPRPR